MKSEIDAAGEFIHQKSDSGSRASPGDRVCETGIAYPMTTFVTDQELAAAVEELPPVSVVLQRLLVVLQNPDSDVGDIAHYVRADTALATKMLRLANSAHFGLPSHVASIEEAIQQIGIAEVHRLVSVLGSRQLIARPLAQYGITASVLWQHTLAVAVGAEAIAERLGCDRGNAYLAGILHPIGFVALDRVAAARALAPRPEGDALLEWERAHFDTDNPTAAARVLLHWKFPGAIAEAVGLRYEPPVAAAHLQAGGVLHLASCLAENLGFGLPPEGGLFRAFPERLGAVGLAAEDFSHLEAVASQRLARTRTLLQLA